MHACMYVCVYNEKKEHYYKHTQTVVLFLLEKKSKKKTEPLQVMPVRDIVDHELEEKKNGYNHVGEPDDPHHPLSR